MMRATTLSILALALSACGGGSPPPDEAATAATTLAFTGATVWDGTGAPPIEDATVVVRYGRIVSVGIAPPPEGSQRIDLEGGFVVPGFVNSHGHASGRWAPPSVVGNAARVTGDLVQYARYGVTTVLSLGGMPEDAFDVRDDQQSRTLDHARLYLAGEVVFSQDPAEAAAIAQRNIDAGADWIKLRVDDNLGTAEKMAWPAVQAVMDTAAAAGVPVASHVFYMDDTSRLLDMGTGLVAHSVRDQRVTDEFVQQLLETGTCYVPTLVREVSTFVYAERPEFFDDPFFSMAENEEQMERVSDPEFMAAVAASPSAAGYRQALVQAKENLAILAAAGVPIAFGTDSGPAGRFPGYFEHMEFDLMSEAGMLPIEILLSATSVAAECLGLDDVGTLTPGRWADFVVLGSNPLDDVANLHDLRRVYVAGNRM